MSDGGAFLRNRVSEEQVARVLQLMAAPPNRRDSPRAGDLPGQFDFWFDGGAGRIVTGWTTYHFSDGTRASHGTTLYLSVSIEFPDGRRVEVRQTSGLDNS